MTDSREIGDEQRPVMSTTDHEPQREKREQKREMKEVSEGEK